MPWPMPEAFLEGFMEEVRKARLFRNGRSQAVRIPKEFAFKADEVFVEKQGDRVILSTWPRDWSGLLEGDAVASPEFLREAGWRRR